MTTQMMFRVFVRRPAKPSRQQTGVFRCVVADIQPQPYSNALKVSGYI